MQTQEDQVVRRLVVHVYIWGAAAVLLVLCGSSCSFPGIDDDMRFGREVVENPSEWFCISNRSVVAFARDEDVLKQVVRKAVFSRRRVNQLLPPATNLPPAMIYVVDDAALWKRLSEDHRLKVEGIALLAGREILIRLGDEQDLLRESVPHEYIHYAIRRTLPQTPLALEEGMATYYGWEINLAAHLEQGEVVQRKVRPISGEHLVEVDELVNTEEYPVDKAVLNTFYRQSERFVKAMDTLIGTEQMESFLRETGTDGKDWRDLVLNTYTCTPSQVEWLEKAVMSGKR